MISNDELQHKLQFESFKIICESISEEERVAMNLAANQIIPTIRFFHKMQAELLSCYWQNRDNYYDRNIEFEYCFENWDWKENKFTIEQEVREVNLSLLKYLCNGVGICFYTFEDRYHFEISLDGIYNDIKKKYYI